MTKDQVKSAIALQFEAETELSEETKAYFALCEEKLGMVPNVLQAYAFNEKKLRAFTDMYNDLMLGDSVLSKLEREMIAVVVSSINKCFYCLTAHGAAVRQLSGDPKLGEMMVMNYRVAPLDDKQKAMLDFAALLTESPETVEALDIDDDIEPGPGADMYLPAVVLLLLIVADSFFYASKGAPLLSLSQSVLAFGAAILFALPAAIRYLRR